MFLELVLASALGTLMATILFLIVMAWAVMSESDRIEDKVDEKVEEKASDMMGGLFTNE